jgi:hypothetical protein
MKKNKIITKITCFLIISMLTFLIIPTNASAFCPFKNPFENKQIYKKNLVAYQPENYFDDKLQSPIKNDPIIDMIQQMDESLISYYLSTLVSFGPRRTGTTACIQAGEWIYSEFEDMELDVRYHNWSHGGEVGKNIEATLHGANESSNHIYIICAHYDTVVGSPGADDDGSGVAAVMAAAEILSQYIVNYTVRFLTFSGEEQGLYGSYQYAKDASNNGDIIIGVLNADMIGYAVNQNQGENIDIYYNTQSTWIVDYIDDVSDYYFDYINLNVIYGGYSWGSDHSSFWQFGYNAVQYKEYEVNPYYHTPYDIIENMNITYLLKCSKLFLATIAQFSQITSPNEPPNIPIINGPASGEVGVSYLYLFSATDPDDDILYFFIDWGDNQSEEWIGPYDSGEEFDISHTWEKQGNYTIATKVRDSVGAESDWAYLEVSMPVNQHSYSYPLLQRLLERFPNMFPILRNLFDLE